MLTQLKSMQPMQSEAAHCTVHEAFNVDLTVTALRAPLTPPLSVTSNTNKQANHHHHVVTPSLIITNTKKQANHHHISTSSHHTNNGKDICVACCSVM